MHTLASRRAEEAKWRAESDLRTLMEAEKIKRDAKRFAAAQKLAAEQMTEVAAVAAAAPKDGKS